MCVRMHVCMYPNTQTRCTKQLESADEQLLKIIFLQNFEMTPTQIVRNGIKCV